MEVIEMASANILAGFKPETVELLHSFAAYVDEIDGTEATPTELALSLIEADGRPGKFQAEQIVGAVLAEHRRFQRWLRDRRTVLMQDGWQAWAVRNARAGRTAAFAV
jgi:phosphoglycerate dehydrogenase-like enzyme